MWMLPNNLDISRCALDTTALGLPLGEFSEMCEQWLLWRSKPFAAKTWYRRVKKNSWLLSLSSQTLKSSHSESFVDAWTSYLRASHASRLVKPVLDKVPLTNDIYFLQSSQELSNASPQLSFWKTSGELSAQKQPMENQFSNMSSEAWKKWVTDARLEYSARKKRALSINASEFLSTVNWATPSAQQPGITVKRLQTKDGSPPQLGQRLYDKYTGRNCQIGLAQQVQIAQQNWPTPSATDGKSGSGTIVEEGDKFYRVSNTTQTRFGARLDAVVEHLHKKNMYKRRYLCAQAKEPDIPTGKLSAEWVEKLMGVPSGWTRHDGTSKDWSHEWPQEDWEQGVPRVTGSNGDRVDRLRLLGNGVCPATAALAFCILSYKIKKEKPNETISLC